MHSVLAYTDGGCRGNPGLGAWGYVLINVATGSALARACSEANTTNNRMELAAVLNALCALSKPDTEILIRSDSKYTIDSCSTWLAGWKKRGWKRATGPLKNVDILQQLDVELAKHGVKFEWVKGHAGDRGNEYVDGLLNECMDLGATGSIERRLQWD
ncbi:MAG: ribonuclease HI [Planctomycetota bacterium]|jgi:ribonuclease HI|nr:ribonuclease HI [Planctomycetota bacterium]